MILLFGPAGAGKSVQGEKLAERLGWRWMSTGQMFRDSNDEEVKRILATGELIDDQTTFAVVKEAFRKDSDASRIILDGFPRTMAQAEWLEETDSELGRSVELVLALEVSDEEIIRRLSGRGRAEDAPDKIKRRMEIYRAETQPILNFLEKYGVKIARINGEGDVDEIHQRIMKAVKESQLVD